MGLTFHYSGEIRNPQQIQELIEEVKDICESFKWEYHVWPLEGMEEDCLPDDNKNYTISDVKGISFSPANCETLFLTFLPDGRLISPVSFIIDEDFDPSTDQTIHTKTQFAGIDVHLTLMKLLLYLNEKYFAKLSVIDEGNYWETRNEEILKSQFTRYEGLIAAVSDALSGMKPVPGENADSLSDRIEQILIDFQKQNESKKSS